MIDAVFDTNILIDYMLGVEEAKHTLTQFQDPAISIVTWIEFLVGAQNDREEQKLERFLTRFTRIDIDTALARRAARIRRQHRLKLPDSVILATAEKLDCPLISRDESAFRSAPGLLVVPYQL